VTHKLGEIDKCFHGEKYCLTTANVFEIYHTLVLAKDENVFITCCISEYILRVKTMKLTTGKFALHLAFADCDVLMPTIRFGFCMGKKQDLLIYLYFVYRLVPLVNSEFDFVVTFFFLTSFNLGNRYVLVQLVRQYMVSIPPFWRTIFWAKFAKITTLLISTMQTQSWWNVWRKGVL